MAMGGGGSEINRDFVIVTDSKTRGSFQVFSSLQTMIGNLRIGERISASELIFNLPSRFAFKQGIESPHYTVHYYNNNKFEYKNLKIEI